MIMKFNVFKSNNTEKNFVAFISSNLMSQKNHFV